MTKHRFDVCGVSCTGGNLFTGVCVADDVIKAIELFRKDHYSVHNIEMKEQVHDDEEIGIKNINILHIYPVEHGCKGKTLQDIRLALGRGFKNTYGNMELARQQIAEEFGG